MKRRSGSGRQRGVGGWLTLALLVAASFFVAWQVVKASSADALLKTNPFMASAVAPRDPRIPMAVAMFEFQAAGGQVRPETRRAAAQAFSRLPLAYEPLFLAGMSALVDGDEARARQLLVEARRRAPRSRVTRLILLDRFLRDGDIDQATVEMKALGNLIPRAGSALVGELARLAQEPATSASLEAALRKSPDLRDPLLDHLARKGADPNLILRLARRVPASRGASASAEWKPILLAGLVEKGQLDRAYALWRTLSAPAAPQRKEGVYDSNFRGLPGLAPFNWHFNSGAAGVAERSGNGLNVEYYGRDPADLGGQLLMLTPGRYRLSFIAEGSAAGEGTKLSWKLFCGQSKSELAEMVLRKVDYSPKRFIGEFAIPASGCSSQRLRLIGAPAEFIKPQSAAIRQVQIATVP